MPASSACSTWPFAAQLSSPPHGDASPRRRSIVVEWFSSESLSVIYHRPGCTVQQVALSCGPSVQAWLEAECLKYDSTPADVVEAVLVAYVGNLERVSQERGRDRDPKGGDPYSGLRGEALEPGARSAAPQEIVGHQEQQQ